MTTIKEYRIGDWSNVRSDFERIFNTSIAPFYDGNATVIFGKIRIKLFVFDDYLHQVHGDYEDWGLSMQDLIREKYGEEGDKLINALI
jgi:hypothetical protein